MASVVFRWLGAGVLASIALWLSALNWWALVKRFRGRSSPSWIPLAGGALGAGALVLQPIDSIRMYWWIAFLLDAGSAPGILWTVLWHIVRKWKNE